MNVGVFILFPYSTVYNAILSNIIPTLSIITKATFEGRVDYFMNLQTHPRIA